MDLNDTNNRAELRGIVEEEPVFSHEIFGEKFYLFILCSPRLSGVGDHIRVIVSERIMADCCIKRGCRIAVTGQFRSYNSCDGDSSHLVLSVFARDIKEVTDEMYEGAANSLYLNGYVCKEPVYRTTPFGREICDILLAVNRTYNKSDYIPIIAWGRNARFLRHTTVGSNIKVWGRIQSRTYQKKLGGDEVVEKTAYEVSVCRLQM